ncbi:MAG TPA: hypothetical protein VGM68_10955 [Rhizomicrobium sp.]|jgi:hypothetical protein
MPDTAFQALKIACRHQIHWLNAQATAYEQGRAQHIEIGANGGSEISENVAEQFRHQANNLQAVIDAYERLRA